MTPDDQLRADLAEIRRRLDALGDTTVYDADSLRYFLTVEHKTPAEVVAILHRAGEKRV